MLVFFTIFLPEDISQKINAQRTKYDPNYKRLAPHITIIPPFEPTKNIAPLIKDIQNALNNIEPFEIELDGIGSFKKLLNSAVFVDVIDGQALKEIQKSIFFILESCGAKLGKYKKSPNFHVTIAKKLNIPSVLIILKELENFRVKEKFLVEKISVCMIEKNEPWQIKEEIYLGNKKNNTK